MVRALNATRHGAEMATCEDGVKLYLSNWILSVQPGTSQTYLPKNLFSFLIKPINISELASL